MDRETKQRVVGAAALMVLATILIPLMFGSPQDPRATIQPSFTAPLAAEVPAVPTPAVVARREAASTPRPSPTAMSATPTVVPETPVTAPPLPTPRATPKVTPKAAPRATPTATPRATPRATPAPTATPRPTVVPTPRSEPPPRAKPLTPPAETPETDGAHRWTVQVASYKYEDPAKRLKGELAQSGYDSFIVSKLINGTRYYRVRVYVVGSESQVMAVQGRIEKRFKVSTRRYY